MPPASLLPPATTYLVGVAVAAAYDFRERGIMLAHVSTMFFLEVLYNTYRSRRDRARAVGDGQCLVRSGGGVADAVVRDGRWRRAHSGEIVYNSLCARKSSAKGNKNLCPGSSILLFPSFCCLLAIYGQKSRTYGVDIGRQWRRGVGGHRNHRGVTNGRDDGLGLHGDGGREGSEEGGELHSDWWMGRREPVL